MKHDLYHGDVLEVLDKLIVDGVKVDAVVTDPAYKVITGGKNGQKGKPSGILTANKQLMKSIPEFSEWLPKCYEILNDDSHIYVMTNLLNLQKMMTEIENAGFVIHNLLVWKKNTPTPNKWYMKNCEYTIFARKGKAKFINNCGSQTVHESKNPRNKLHPTEKPVDLMKMYVSNSVKKGQVVLDPFKGSGSTMVACEELGISSIGIDNGICEDDKVINSIQLQGLTWKKITQLRLDGRLER